MQCRWIFCSLLLSSLVTQDVFGMSPRNKYETPQTKQPLICGKTPRTMRVSARHIEGNGVGYSHGYTSVDGFFAFIDPADAYWIPFLDTRVHVFNNGRPAVNAGVGVRYLGSQRVWGLNAYYDYRNTHHHNYNQASLGLETLGELWDLRLNGYLPVGRGKSSFSHPQFDHFEGHHLIVRRKREFALKSANAEVGFHVDTMKKMPFYFAGGPYYLVGQGKQAWGFEARATVDIIENVRLEANTSYDRIFRGIAQGQISLIFPFGPKKDVKHRKNKCHKELALWTRSLQRVDRNEIIPLSKHHRESVAIDPVTDEPYFFWFVDNTSHSNGTFKSPFNTLIAAQDSSHPRDIIYVFSGDGTYSGMNQGIILQNNQKLLGSGNSYRFLTTHGTVTVPALTHSQPIITNSLDSIVICANNNEIAGMHISTNNFTGISCDNTSNVFIHDNQIDANQSAGIFIQDASGVFTIQNNILNVLENSNGILVSSAFDGTMNVNNNVFQYDVSGDNFGIHLIPTTASASNYVFYNNQFIAPLASPSTGFEFGQNGSPIPDFNSLIISGNLFLGLGSNGGGGKPIGGFGFGGLGRVTISNNLFSNVGPGVQNPIPTTVLLRIQADGNLIFNLANNRWESSQDIFSSSLNVFNNDVSSSACVVLKNNQSDVDSGTTAYNLDNSAGGVMTTDVSGNVGTVTETNTTPGTCP